MIKYKTGSKWDLKIEKVYINRETDKCVFVNNFKGCEVRESKKSEWHTYHDTWEDAHLYLITRCQRFVKSYESQLQKAKCDLENVEAMRQES